MEFRQEGAGMRRRVSIEDYDLFQNLFVKTQNMVRTQSKLRLARQESQEQLQMQYQGSEFWQKQSQNSFGDHIEQINESIQEIIKMMEYLLNMHDEEMRKKIAQTIKQLQLLDGQLKIVKELLLNCTKGPTKALQVLKETIRLSVKGIIQAQKASQVNVIMLTYLRDYLVDDLLPHLLSLCQKTLYNDVAVDKVQLTSEMRLTTSRVKMLNLLFCSAVDMSRNDLMSLDRNHPDWKAIYAATTFKALGDPEKIHRSFENFAKMILLGHALVNSQSEYKNVLAKKLVLAWGVVYYFLWESRAFQHAMNHISDLQVDNAISVMNMVDQPGLKNVMALNLPSIAYHKKIYIDPIVMPITTEQLNREIDEGTINKITPINILTVNQELHNQDGYRKELFMKTKSKLKIRILCSETLLNPQEDTGFDYDEDDTDLWKQLTKFFSKPKVKIDKIHESVIIHIHGGGFISQSSSTHQCHTRDWAIALGVPIFSIDYSLSPKFPYPAALDDCWQAYHWILNSVSKYFNISPKKIYLSGDSAGGNLSLALAGILIKFGQKAPDGIMVAYPASDIRFTYSPSYLYSLNDKILSHTILGICIHSYSSNPKCQLMKDPFISPVLLSDEIFAKFPPTRILCGTKDPLVDCTWRFVTKMLKNNRDCKVIMYEQMSHGFLNFKTINGMKEIETCIQDSIDCFRELMTKL